MKYAIILAAVFAMLCSAAPAWAQETLTEKVTRLENEAAALRRRIAELETALAAKSKPKSKMTIVIHGDEEAEADGPVLNQPLDDKQRAAVAAATKAMDALAAEAGKRPAPVSSSPVVSRATTLARWAEATKKVAELYAEYGQEKACLTTLAGFRTWERKSSGSQTAFDATTYNCAKTFAEQWERPNSAMRIAARYGPKSRTVAVAWGKLCESAAKMTGERAHKELALKCYLRAAVVTNDRDAWRSVRRLEAELKTKN